MGGGEVRRSEPIKRLFVVKPAQTDPTISDAPPDDTSYCAAGNTLHLLFYPSNTLQFTLSRHCAPLLCVGLRRRYISNLVLGEFGDAGSSVDRSAASADLASSLTIALQSNATHNS